MEQNYRDRLLFPEKEWRRCKKCKVVELMLGGKLRLT
mgnify:CR=1 FL=1